jgi:uncharacterized phage-associated protein
MYGALTIARYIINKCNENHSSISNLKLQKILYFVQAEFLVEKGEACFSEDIHAWDFGPVVPDVYQKYKVYGTANIPSVNKAAERTGISEDDRKIIDDMIKECSKYSAAELAEITRKQSPWKQAYSNRPNVIIPCAKIKDFFGE